MAEKYYISNNIRFAQGYGNLLETPDGATHYRGNEADKFLYLHPDCVPMKHGNSKTRKFVITTMQKYVGKSGGIVTDRNNAMSFNSADDAFQYIDSHPKLNNLFDEIYVINSKYKKMKRKVDPLVPVISPDGIRRVRFSPAVRRQVYSKSNVCAICGCQVGENDYTVDHIVPLSRGGTNDIDNLRVAHESCNKLKGNFLDEEVYEKIAAASCNHLFNSPTSEMSKMYIRSIVRGAIKKYDKRE